MRSKLRYTLLFVAQLLLFWSGWAAAAVFDQPPADSPFNMTGFIQAATLDNPADVLSGGTVTVNGTDIVIPRNTIVIMSASNISWQEVFAFAPCPWGLKAGTGPVGGQFLPTGACPNGNGQSGLAMSDAILSTTGIPTVKPLTTYEVTIMGNRIADVDPITLLPRDRYVAGVVYMAQHALNLGQGVINFIDYATGTLHVGGPVLGSRSDATTGCNPLVTKCDALIQINDPAQVLPVPAPLPPGPTGRYSLGKSPDPRFTADTDNPTIRAKTGYPMCIPRALPPAAVLPGTPPPPETDPLCPQRNRPLDPAQPAKLLGNFTLCNPGSVLNGTDPNPSLNCKANAPPVLAGVINAIATAVPGSDATQQVPFQVGDYIEYSGTVQQDDLTGTATGVPASQDPATGVSVPVKYLSAWQIIGNIGAFTSPGAVPAYVAQELLLQGTGGLPLNPAVPQEVTTRIKTVGFFTDPTRTVDLFTVQPDSCTGFETEMLMLAQIPQNKGAVPWGRFRDVDQAGLFPINRQWRVKYTPVSTDAANLAANCPATGCANGLNVMQFTAPVSTFITPENTIFGDPTLLAVPQNFQDFPFLVNGEGPWRNNPANLVGQLFPFPRTLSAPTPQSVLTNFPLPLSCGAAQPTVVITPPNQTVAGNTKVTLDASASHSNPTGHTLAFVWTQVSGIGPLVTLANGTTPTATFTSPKVTVNTQLIFEVAVTDTVANTTAIGTTIVEVAPGKVGLDTVTIAPGGVVYRLNRGVLNATATSSDGTCAAVLTLTTVPNIGLPVGGVLMTPGKPVGGACPYTFISGKQLFPAPTSVTVISSETGADTATTANGKLLIK